MHHELRPFAIDLSLNNSLNSIIYPIKFTSWASSVRIAQRDITRARRPSAFARHVGPFSGTSKSTQFDLDMKITSIRYSW